MLQKQTSLILSWLYLAVLVLLPFHAFLTTWAGSSLGGIDAWRIWKDVLIFVSVPFAAHLALTNPEYMRWFKRSWLVRFIGIYVLLYLLSGVFAYKMGQVNGQALVYSLLSNLRFLGFFLLVTIVAARSAFLHRHAFKAVLVAGAVVVAFGLVQLVLPNYFLTHFGYGPGTIPAFHTIDNKPDYQRIQSTLRGPNPLGAYLVVILSLLVAYWRLVLRPFSWKFIVFAVGIGAALFFSYSRSAYLGALVSMGVIIVTALGAAKFRKYLVIGACVVVVFFGGTVYLLRDNDTVQNTLFHTDETSLSEMSSNEGRKAALVSGVRDVASEPFGRGPGTAGPASMRNDRPARIAESYFLQIGQEVGVLGIALFVAINVMVGRLLWLNRRSYLALGLFASLIGLSVVNLVSHAWADDTLGLLWWGLAGIALMPAIMEQKANKKHEIPAQKKRKKRS